MKRILILLCAAFFSLAAEKASAQFYAVRLNTLALATGTLHLGADITLSEKLSLDFSGYWNPIHGKRLRAELLAGEVGVRLWRFEPNVGPFWGAQALGGRYHVGNRHRHFKGFAVGAGASYGHAWMLSKRWSLIAEAGVGIFYVKDTERLYGVPCTEDEIVARHRRCMILPTKAEVSFSYLF